MIERMTYLAAAAAAIVSWLITILVSDLTDVPILYHTSSTADAAVGGTHVSRTRLVLINLSRSKPVIDFVVFAKGRPTEAGSGLDCLPDDSKIYPSGIEWTSAKSAANGRLEVSSLMPGSSLRIGVEQPRGCTAAFAFAFLSTPSADGKVVPVRVVSAGLESFLLRNWLRLIGALLALAGLTYALAFAITCWRAFGADRSEARVKRIVDEAAVAEAGARKVEADLRRIETERKLMAARRLATG
ncbi:MAG: hypothetical protein K2Y40_24755 [Reyranella sp.]|jgi:hypothetical protein|nr:hypothetical protein [Reyranella sp.]